VCDLETSRMGAPYIYDISRLRVKDLHSATYIYVVRRLRVNTTVFKIQNFSKYFLVIIIISLFNFYKAKLLYWPLLHHSHHLNVLHFISGLC